MSTRGAGGGRDPRRRARDRGGAGRGGRTVYCTGRSTRRAAVGDRPAGDDRGDRRAGRPRPAGTGSRSPIDHLDPDAVAALVARIDAEQGRLDVLVNDIWGAEHLFEWDTPVWEHDLDGRACGCCGWPSTRT